MTLPVLEGSAPYGVSIPAASGKAITGTCLLYGVSIRESTGSASAHMQLWDGGDATGQQMATFMLAASGADFGPLAAAPLLFRSGIYVDQVSGSIHGVLYVVRVLPAVTAP